MLALFDRGPARLTPLRPRRLDLGGGAWVDLQPGWLKRHQQLMDQLVPTVQWQQRERQMWDQRVLEPRLTATVPEGGGAPVLHDIGAALAAHYTAELRRITLSLYRDGRDSVAAHSDRGDAGKSGALTVSVSLGAPRKLLLKPKAGGRSRPFHLGWGDLFVMGGTIQRGWTHGVPKCAQAPPRLACLFWLGGSGRQRVVLDQAAAPRGRGVGQQPRSGARVALGQRMADGMLVDVVGGTVGPVGQDHRVLHAPGDGRSAARLNPSAARDS